MDYKINIGLEVHVELNTNTKMFCRCKSSFGEIPNSNICPICLAIPGTLPRPNKKALELAIKAGIATNCYINNEIKFDRKNYFYPDLPKSYQITQFYKPICEKGYIKLDGKQINIKEIHIEEDAGKIIHDDINNISLIDYNRAGIPLLEIVTQPDFENYNQVIEFLEKLKEILVYMNISDCKIQEGSMRVDVNLSVIKKYDKHMGNRIEIKNIGSFKAIKSAIEYETRRQIDVLESGGEISIETRRFSERENKTIFMRFKEDVSFYSYFCEPDINRYILSEDFIENIKNNMEELPSEKRKRFKEKYELSNYDINIIMQDKNLAFIFEEIEKLCNNPKEVVNLVIVELLKMLKEDKSLILDLDISFENISKLIKLVLDNKITRDIYKKVFYKVLIENIDPILYIEENNLFIIQDLLLIKNIVIKVLEQNNQSIIDYKNGKEKSIKFLIGQTMKYLNGKCDPILIKKLLIDEINKYLI